MAAELEQGEGYPSSTKSSIDLFCLYPALTSYLSIFLHLSLSNPSAYFFSLLFRSYDRRESAVEDSNVSYTYLRVPFRLSFIQLLHMVLFHFASPSSLAATRLSTYLSPHVSLCPSIRRFSTPVFTPSSRFFHCRLPASQPVSATQTVDTRCYRSILKRHFPRTLSC